MKALERVTGAAQRRQQAFTIALYLADEMPCAYDELIATKRATPGIVVARSLWYYLIRRHYGWSYPTIAMAVSRDHTAVMLGVQKIEACLGHTLPPTLIPPEVAHLTRKSPLAQLQQSVTLLQELQRRYKQAVRHCQTLATIAPPNSNPNPSNTNPIHTMPHHPTPSASSSR